MSMYDESRATAACLALGCADMELKVPADGKDSRRSQGARALAAFRPLVWLGSEGSWGSAITQEAVVAARRGFQRMIPEALATRDGM